MSKSEISGHRLALRHENRRFQRVRVRLFGRYMLSDGREFPCQITDISPGGVAIAALACGSRHERVVVYADHLGRLEGKIVRLLPDGFAMTIFATSEKRDKLAAQLTWLANRDLLDQGEQRRYKRVVPRDPHATLTLLNGTCLPCMVISVSSSGAAIASKKKLPIGLLAALGTIQSRVARHIDGGFLVEFTRLQNVHSLEASIASSSDMPRLLEPHVADRRSAASPQLDAICP
jgi:PilZ domain-containing protein